MPEFALTDYMKFALALVFVLALIALFALLARRLGLGGSSPAKRGRGRRLAISEILALDGKRKLVLVRRDDTEHLVILGPTSETVVENGIAAGEAGFAAAAVAAGRREPQLRPPAAATTLSRSGTAKGEGETSA